MNGGEIIGRVLKAQGVRFLFTLCGGHISPILVGAKRAGLRVVDTRHEATAVFAADAVARLSGIPGVAAVTAGPGVTNTLTAVQNARLAQSPVVLLGGATATVLRKRGALQDIDQLALIRSSVKWSASARRVRDIEPLLRQAPASPCVGKGLPTFRIPHDPIRFRIDELEHLGKRFMLAPELSIPALFAAGLTSAPHCGMMCGPLQGWFLSTRGTLPVRDSLLWLHTGRVLGYAVLGAIAGATGGVLLRLAPSPVIGQVAQILAAATLVVAALRQLRAPSSHGSCHIQHRSHLSWLSPPFRLLAGFSGGAGSGAALLLAFGLGTVPVLSAVGGVTSGLQQPVRLKRVATAVLLVFGIVSTYAVLTHPAWLSDAWCLPVAEASFRR